MNKARKALLTDSKREECKRINYVWGDMIKILREELDGWCEECGSSGNELSGHHIIPKELEGESTRENTIMLCPDCHDKMHNRNNYSIEPLIEEEK